MAEGTAVARVENGTTPARTSESAKDRWEIVARQADAWSKSTIIPSDYRGKPSNCLVALEMSHRTGVPVLAVMQNLFVIQGKPSWSAQFLIAAANASGRFSPLRYRFEGKEGTEDWGCRVVATDLRSGEELIGSPVTMRMAKAEGWSTKSGSKWLTMPEQMLRYRAAAFWARTYAPELAVGLQTVEEVEDVTPLPNERVRELVGVLDAGDDAVPEEEPEDTSPASAEQLKQLKGLLPKAREVDVIDAADEELITAALDQKDGPAVRHWIREAQTRIARGQESLV